MSGSSTRPSPFRTRWAQHDVRQHRGGVKRFRHPDVGALELTYCSLPRDLPVPGGSTNTGTLVGEPR